jgi:four helix bundle protein
MQNFKDLEIYQLAHKLAVDIHKMSIEDLPSFEMYEQGSQIRRSSKSIVSNIVEGFGRKQYQPEYIKFLTYAIASCDETKSHLVLLNQTGSLKDSKQTDHFVSEYEKLGKMLYRFRESIKT